MSSNQLIDKYNSLFDLMANLDCKLKEMCSVHHVLLNTIEERKKIHIKNTELSNIIRCVIKVWWIYCCTFYRSITLGDQKINTLTYNIIVFIHKNSTKMALIKLVEIFLFLP